MMFSLLEAEEEEEAVSERRIVDICCDDSPHDEAARPSLRTFHTVSRIHREFIGVANMVALANWRD
jgi:hypothetical protein